MQTVNDYVEQLTSYYQIMWWDIPVDFPKMPEIYQNSRERNICQKEKERELNRFIKDFFHDIKKSPVTDTELLELQEKLKLQVKRLSHSSTLSNEFVEGFSLLDDFYPVTKDFIQTAKDFEPEVTNEEIFQAIRNVWIMNSLQVLLGVPVKLTHSIFAYSMLYPFTDNYLDDLRVSPEIKRGFNLRLKELLQGNSVQPDNFQELRIFKLVRKIEAQYPRKEYPEVYQSLLAIQNAQEKSLVQQSQHTSPYETDILGISIKKGGSSVLADGYLVAGDLEPETAQTIFGIGVFLQFIDDLEDVTRDYQNGHMTIFSQMIPVWSLDKITNRLLHIIDRVLGMATCFHSNSANLALKNLFLQSCYQMVFEAVSQNAKYYSDNYVRNIENYTPVRLSYLRKQKVRIKKQFSSVKNTRFTDAGMSISSSRGI